MHTDTRLGTFAHVVAGMRADVKLIARRLRTLIAALHPSAVEVPRPGERTSAYGLGSRKMTEAYAYIAPYREYVNLGFYHGASLSDPEGLLEGAGKELRHVKVRSINDVERPAMRRLLNAALKERRAALGR